MRSHWHIDGTFYVVPNSFHQLIVVLVHEMDSDLYIPATYILTTHKFEEFYSRVFAELQMIIGKDQEEVKRITLDFEKSLKNSIMKTFGTNGELDIIGCK